MSKIKSIKAREISDSRGNPTVETEVFLDSGARGKASVPSGASTGEHEAVELRDEDGGVNKAIDNVNDVIAKDICNKKFISHRALDEDLIKLDGTDNKSKLGANAILSVSLAFARAVASDKKIELYEYIKEVSNTEVISLPYPMMNIVNGGQHADSGLDVQEYMIVPQDADYEKNLDAGKKIFEMLEKNLSAADLSTEMGDEGGFAPKLSDNEQALGLIVDAIKEAGFEPGENVNLALDVAASEFYGDDKYIFDNKKIFREDLIEIYRKWINKYPLMSIEDPLYEGDWEGWQAANAELGEDVMVVGDDHFVTNMKRLERGIKEKTANAILIKLNQIGTLTETLDVIKKAKESGLSTIISHRSGETMDDFIADLAFGTDAGYIKTGAPSKKERMVKYERLLEISNIINKNE